MKIKVVDVGYISKTGKEISFGLIDGNNEVQYPNLLKIKLSFNDDTHIKSIVQELPRIKH